MLRFLSFPRTRLNIKALSSSQVGFLRPFSTDVEKQSKSTPAKPKVKAQASASVSAKRVKLVNYAPNKVSKIASKEIAKIKSTERKIKAKELLLAKRQKAKLRKQSAKRSLQEKVIKKKIDAKLQLKLRRANQVGSIFSEFLKENFPKTLESEKQKYKNQNSQSSEPITQVAQHRIIFKSAMALVTKQYKLLDQNQKQIYLDRLKSLREAKQKELSEGITLEGSNGDKDKKALAPLPPHKPASAYVLFIKSRFKSVECKTVAETRQFMKQFSGEWKSLDLPQKTEFQLQAKQITQNYYQQKQKYDQFLTEQAQAQAQAKQKSS